MIAKIKKRDGKVVDFNPEKIKYAAEKAFLASEMNDQEIGTAAQRVTDKVVTKLDMMFNGVSYPTVEQTQDLVENAMMELGHHDAAKKYIIYRELHKQKREMDSSKQAIFDFSRRLVNGYMGGDDWRSKENANSGSITFQGANARLAGEVWNNFALNEMYGKENPEIKSLHESGAMHIHDLDFPVIAYCCGHSLEQLIRRGFGSVAERVQSSPAKHLETIVAHIVNYIGTMQGEFAGAQAFSSVDTFLAPFVRADNLTQERVNQHMQQLIFGLNVPSRWGWQAPFSNLTFDLSVPEDLKNKPALVAGRELESTYGDYQKEMDMINKGFLKTMMKGDKAERIFTFPIPTYNLTKNFNWDSEVSNLLFDVTGKYGIPYFQNYLGSDLDPGAIRAMCCRLNLDQNELMRRPGNMWGPGDSTGSIGVVTLNMNRIGYEAEGDEQKFFDILGHRMDIASQSLEIKRKTIEDFMEAGAVPYTKSYLGHFNNHFSTIGLCGMNEACQNFLGKDISTEEGKNFAVKTLNFMRGKIKGYQNESGSLYNLEATPAESTSYKFAKRDKETYPNIFVSGNGTPFLTNSTQLPVDLKTDLYTALKHQEELQTMYNGGTIFHTFVGEKMDGESAKNLVRKIAESTRLPYFSITPVFSICPEHKYLAGKHEICTTPGCEETPEIYDRIVGYLRPVNAWNPGKKEEFKYRKRINEKRNYVKV
jgi:ribonucleoside-triphosphate reductase